MSQELLFVSIFLGFILLIIGIKAIQAIRLNQKSKQNAAKTRKFYTEVEKEVNKRKK
jgi:hypothetical protein